jgi:hypothetical protein
MVFVDDIAFLVMWVLLFCPAVGGGRSVRVLTESRLSQWA